MTNRIRGAWITVVVATVWGVTAIAQSPGGPSKPAAPRAAAPREPAVATVGGTRITRASFDQRVREAEESYRTRSTSPLPAEFRPIMRRQILEGMIREQLLALEAARRGMGITREQAEEELKRDPFFRRDGMLDEAKYLAIRTTQPREFENAIAEIQRTLPARRLKDQIERQNRPDEAKLRAAVERDLSQVTIDFLALRRGTFSADNPVPSERDVIEYYRAHAAEHPRPEQVRITMVTVDKPALDLAATQAPAAMQAWEARIRARADSLLTAVRGGADLQALVPAFGSISVETVEREKFPAAWRGNARTRQLVFSTAPGQWVSEQIPGPSGVLLARVDEHLPKRNARLNEIAVLIRSQLRDQMLRQRDDGELREIYQSVRDSLRGPARRIRYAVIDTGLVRVSEPTAAELDRYYRGHLADYSFYDSKTGSVGAKPLAEVSGEVRSRILFERRTQGARATAEQLLAVWRSGKRDPKLEKSAAAVREVGPIATGTPVDTGLAGQVLTDSLGMRTGGGADAVRFSRGWVVYYVTGIERDFAPTFEQARSMLAQRLESRRLVLEEEAARRFYEADPKRVRTTDAVHFSRLMVNPPDPLTVPITRPEVEQYYKTHLDDYGAPELARARHLLVSPRDASADADAEARREAEQLMARVNAGEKLADLAREHSDDQATRANGGDVGVFRHGMMLDDFERVAFAMKPGEIRGPIRTEIGYHIIESLEHVPAEVTPLKYAYSNVAADLARSKAERIGKARADSLHRVLRTKGQALRAAEQMGLLVYRNEHVIGSPVSASALRDYFGRIEQLKPGQFDSMPQEYAGMGHAITWVDSIVPPRNMGWNAIRDRALEVYRQKSAETRMQAKRAELDSLARAGWSLDSLGALFGGLERHGPRGPGSGLERLSGRTLLDSLAFGTRSSPPVLQRDKVTDWVEFPAGLVKMRLENRHGPEGVQLAARIENESRVALERNLRAAFDAMKKRFPVQILDTDLRITDLPAIPDS